MFNDNKALNARLSSLQQWTLLPVMSFVYKWKHPKI